VEVVELADAQRLISDDGGHRHAQAEGECCLLGGLHLPVKTRGSQGGRSCEALRASVEASQDLR
jgi:hypothetical protein